MEGQRIAQLKEAVENLTGLDDSLTGRFARFSARERITLVPFRGQVQDAVYFEIDSAEADSDTMQQIRNYVSTLQADGGTAIYSSLAQAYRYLENVREEDQTRGQERYYSIVLMSDGENTEDTTLRDFERFFTGLAPTTRTIKTFPVLFGNANEEEMTDVAELTGGRVFDGRSETLSLVFKQIRGYQ
jgi:Ca-activated chloride channel family protein